MDDKEIADRLEEMANGLETSGRIYKLDEDIIALRLACEKYRNTHSARSSQ